MTNQKVVVIGSWVTAIGTIAAAIGSTPLRSLKGEDKKRWDYVSEQLDFGGNSFQAIGNIIEVGASDDFKLEEAGEVIQASGNVTVLFSINTTDNEVKKIKLNVTGNAQQAFGGLLAAIAEFLELVPNGEAPLGIIGNLLQSIGNTLQAIAGLIDLEIIDEKVLIGEYGELEEEDGLSVLEYAIESEEYTISEHIKMNAQLSELVKYSGSWIQAGGSIISAVSEQRVLARLRELEKELEKKKCKKRRKKRKRKNTSTSTTVNKKSSTSAEYSEVRKKN
ncbi:hypothetical protein [Bacillus sp. EAC]|uniref:DUF6944 family repetitive protein n=1 Tax=Bacillus sp. EAC TaxID=1978338 RepID=UPI000B44CD54|nr:hypothetical protein [Bacillus sp. EAC]